LWPYGPSDIILVYTRRKEFEMVNDAAKVDLSSRLLSEARKRAVKEAYIPTNVRNSCKISVNQSGDVTVSRKKQ